MGEMNVDIVVPDLKFGPLTRRETTDMIVIHHTGENDIDASAEQIHEWHLNNGWSGIGYHFVIRKDGTIERGRPEWAVGSHAYGENSHTIGIHVSGDFMQAEPTEIQIEHLAMLIADLCQDYGIPCDMDHIVGHGELMPTSCPGTNLQALLDDGTITGKGNWYMYGPEEKKDEPTVERFNTIDECPEWARATVQKMIDKGLLNGNGEGFDLSLDMLRMFVINDRAGLY